MTTRYPEHPVFGLGARYGTLTGIWRYGKEMCQAAWSEYHEVWTHRHHHADVHDFQNGCCVIAQTGFRDRHYLQVVVSLRGETHYYQIKLKEARQFNLDLAILVGLQLPYGEQFVNNLAQLLISSCTIYFKLIE